jgi:hypothetical protein
MRQSPDILTDMVFQRQSKALVANSVTPSLKTTVAGISMPRKRLACARNARYACRFDTSVRATALPSSLRYRLRSRAD